MAVSRDELVGAYRRLADTGEQAFILSTCLRFEVLVPGDSADLERVLKTLHGEWAETATGVERFDTDALHHIYRVASGVESPVIGEVEILAQVRESMGVAREVGALHGSFRSLVEGAISAGRAAREELPESPHGSFAAIVAQLVGPHGEVAVFGAGTMARSMVTALQFLPAPPSVAMYVRRPDELAIDGVDIRSMSDAADALRSFPAVVSATSAQHRLFSVSEMRSAVNGRAKTLTLVDLAMPPDFEPGDIRGIRYIGIDELADRARLSPRSFAADHLIAHAAGEAISRVRNHEKAGPVISAMMVEARRAVAEEVDRFAGRLSNSEDRAVLEQLASTVAKRILHKPVSYLSSGEEGNEASDVIARAFGVENA
jgi:glutamyl-tRNA reductase